MHPFTLATRTYLQWLLSERPEIPERSNCEKSNGNKIKFYQFKSHLWVSKDNKIDQNWKQIIMEHFFHWIYLNPKKLSQKVKNWFTSYLKYSNNFPFSSILEFFLTTSIGSIKRHWWWVIVVIVNGWIWQTIICVQNCNLIAISWQKKLLLFSFLFVTPCIA